MRNKKLSYLIKVAMLSALAVVIMQLKFPVPFIAPPFYKLEFSDLPALIGGFALGPLAGVIVEGVKVLLNLVIDGTTTMYIGEISNFIIGCSYILPATFLYKYIRTKKGALIGVLAGTVVIGIVGCILNALVLLPVYAKVYGMPIESLIAMGTKVNAGIKDVFTFVALAVLPFNLIKGAVTSLVAMLIYKPLSPLLKR